MEDAALQKLPRRLKEFLWYGAAMNISTSNILEYYEWSQQNELYPKSWDAILKDMRALSRKEHIALYGGERPEDG